jgi:hypothetical protein
VFIPTNLTANNLPCQRYDPTTAGFLNFAILSIYFKKISNNKKESEAKKSFPRKKSDKRMEQDFSMFLCSAIKRSRGKSKIMDERKYFVRSFLVNDRYSVHFRFRPKI